MRMPNWGQRHTLTIDALIGILSDEQVVRMLANQCPQKLPMRWTEVLSLVHQHMIGDIVTVHVGGSPQVDRGDGRRLREVDGTGDVCLSPVGPDDAPDRGSFGPV
jgi:hypothetical protein